jgi:hypothetical protein
MIFVILFKLVFIIVLFLLHRLLMDMVFSYPRTLFTPPPRKAKKKQLIKLRQASFLYFLILLFILHLSRGRRNVGMGNQIVGAMG